MITRNIAVGGTSFRFSSGDPAAGTLLDARFREFMTADPGPVEVEVDLVLDDALAARPGVPIQLSRTNGRFRLVSTGVHAEFALTDQRVRLRSAARSGALDAFFRLFLSHRLVNRGGLLIHASAVMRHGRAWVFAGPSGAGKSTIARLLPGERLCDEAVALVPSADGGVVVEGTPYWEGVARRAPVAGLFFLARGGSPGWSPLTAARTAGRLFGNAGPLVPEFEAATLAAAASLAGLCPFHGELSLSCLGDITDWLPPRLDSFLCSG